MRAWKKSCLLQVLITLFNVVVGSPSATPDCAHHTCKAHLPGKDSSKGVAVLICFWAVSKYCRFCCHLDTILGVPAGRCVQVVLCSCYPARREGPTHCQQGCYERVGGCPNKGRRCPHMYVSMYVLMHVCMYACMHVCMYVCMCVRMSVCMYVCVYVQHLCTLTTMATRQSLNLSG